MIHPTSGARVALVLSLSCAGLAGQRAAGPYADVVEAFVRSHGFRGAVLVADGDRIVHRAAVGLADEENRGRNRPETRFRIGSLTKAFTAALTMQLVDEGKVALDAPITRYLEGFKHASWDGVRVEHLLAHASGIPNYTADKGFPAVEKIPLDRETFRRRFLDRELAFEPGSSASYSNSGYYLLGLIIESVTGLRYEVALRDRLLTPLGLHATGYDHPRATIPSRARGYERIAGTTVAAGYLDMAHPFSAGALYSTVDDLHRWARSWDEGALLSEESRRRCETRQAGRFGYGWIIGDRRGDRPGVIFHGGGIEGFRSQLSRYPGSGCVTVVLANDAASPVGALARALADVFHDRDPALPEPPPIARFWERVHAGDVPGALRRWPSLRDRLRLPADFLRRQGVALVSAGALKAGARVLRVQVAIQPEDREASAALATLASPALAGPCFVDQSGALDEPNEWSESVHPLDVDRDGRPDLLFTNCNGWHRPGDMGAPSEGPPFQTLLRNMGTVDGVPRFEDVSAAYFAAGFAVHAKNVAVCDVDGDGHQDLAFAVAFGAQQRLLRFDPGKGRFVDETETRLPELVLNSNGVGYGDFDDDGDLDLVWVDSGPNSDRPPGGKARLLLNDGTGRFREEKGRFPAVPKVGAQNAKVLDIDNDMDLDVVVDGKSPVTQLYLNDGNGRFTLDTKTIPKAGRGSAPYEIEWADLDNDGDLDAAHMSWGGGRRDRWFSVLLRNQLVETGRLGFSVVKDGLSGRNREDENEFAFLDVDDDGNLDLVVATLVSAPTQEKLFLNQGKGFASPFLVERRDAFSNFPDGTLDLAIVDVDGDGRHDIVTAQGESRRFGGYHNRLYLNRGPKDTRPPVVVRHAVTSKGDERVLRVFVRDAIADDGHVVATVKVEWKTESDGGTSPAKPIGGGGHRAVLPSGAGLRYRIIAKDRVGNRAITDWSP